EQLARRLIFMGFCFPRPQGFFLALGAEVGQNGKPFNRRFLLSRPAKSHTGSRRSSTGRVGPRKTCCVPLVRYLYGRYCGRGATTAGRRWSKNSQGGR